MRPLGATPLLPPPTPRAERVHRRISAIRELARGPGRNEVPDAFPLVQLELLRTPRTTREWEAASPVRYTPAAWRELRHLGETSGFIRYDFDAGRWTLTAHGRAELPEPRP